MIAAPAVSDARKVMMAITVTSARDAIASGGTSGTSRRGGGRCGSGLDRLSSCAIAGLIIDMKPAIAQHETASAVELIHEPQIMRGDQDGRARPMQFQKQA